MLRRQVLGGLGAAAALSLTRLPAAAGPRDLAGDIDILERAHTQLHPGLYRYAARDEVAARFTQLRRSFAAAPALADQYRELSQFLATVRCGHTYANFYNQSDAVAAALFQSRNRLPFHFKFINGRMVVTKNQSGDGRLRPGTEIVTVDGIPPARLVETLLAYARADGSNDAKRRALLEVTGSERYESFDIYFPLAFRTGGTFDLVVRAPGDTGMQRFDVAAIDLAARQAGMMPALAGGPDSPQWTVATSGGVVMLTMPNWALYDSKWNWRAFLDDALAGAVGAKGLIVDLRGNEGGLDCGHDIVARLIDRDLKLDLYERRVRFRTTPSDLNPYLETWDKSFRTLGEGAKDMGDGFYLLPREDGVAVIQPKGPRLRAPVIVLVDAQNSSATFQFASIIQSNGLGALLGSATGGNQRGINGGAFFFLRLPASGLEADLPLIGTFPTEPKPDAGLSPNRAIEITAADIAIGRDTVLEAAIRQIAA